MKYVIVMIFALVGLAATEWRHLESNSRIKVHKVCFEDSGVAADEIKKLFAKQHSDDGKLHDYVLCVYKNAGIFTDNEGVQKDKFIDHLVHFDLDKETATEMTNKCVDSNEQKTSSAEWAYRTLECMMANRLEELMDEAAKKSEKEKH